MASLDVVAWLGFVREAGLSDLGYLKERYSWQALWKGGKLHDLHVAGYRACSSAVALLFVDFEFSCRGRQPCMPFTSKIVSAQFIRVLRSFGKDADFPQVLTTVQLSVLHDIR